LTALRKDLRASTADGTATSVTVGIGETYLPAFVLALSGSQLACGLVSTVPLLAGAVLQLVSPWVVQRLGAYRRWVVCCAAIQAAVFLPLLIAALLGAIAVPLVFLLAAVYWGAGMASGSAWNAWMETLVPGRLRVRYFARRTRISQWGVLAGFVAGGLTLQAAAGGRYHVRAFAVLFLAAAVARFLSASCLFSQREPLPPGRRLHSPPLGKLIASLARDTNGPLLIYLLAAQAGVQIAGPYFTPFMLGHLGLNYFRYVTAICAASLARVLFLPILGPVVERFGAWRVFWLASIGIIPLPALWLAADSFTVLIAAQVLAGAIWAAYELATLLLFFETIPAEKRVGVLTAFNLANAAAIVVGSTVGGALLACFAASRAAYLALFVLSALARAGALVLLVRAPRAAASRSATLPVAVQSLLEPASRQPRPATGPYLHGPHRQRGATPAAAKRPPDHPLPQMPG
jgi:MFS family permease